MAEPRGLEGGEKGGPGSEDDRVLFPGISRTGLFENSAVGGTGEEQEQKNRLWHKKTGGFYCAGSAGEIYRKTKVWF